MIGPEDPLPPTEVIAERLAQLGYVEAAGRLLLLGAEEYAHRSLPYVVEDLRNETNRRSQ